MVKPSSSLKEIITIESSDEEQPDTKARQSSSERKPVVMDARRSNSKRPAPDVDDRTSSKQHHSSVSLRYIDPSIRFTTVQRAPPELNIDCVSLESLIGDPDLEIMVQINYMVDPDVIMEKVHESIRHSLRTIIYHGLRLSLEQRQNMEMAVKTKYPNITLHHVPVPGYGTHHTKAMILLYRDDTMQFVVHTANMIERDWSNKTQAVFSTGRLKKKSSTSIHETCAFERELLDYLQHYKHHLVITSRLSQYDFSGIKGVLIGSVPGKYTGTDKNKWGHMRLRSVLRQQVEISKECVQESKIICQISSVGSLGKGSEDWLRGEFETSLNAHRDANYMASRKADLCVVFPTAENVRTSYDGWSMGGSLPFRSTSYIKQAHYLNPLLHSWEAVKSGRERAMPHIKTFTRAVIKPEGDYLSWFLLTSANLSKPAWGETRKDGSFSIQSYELGVLLFPRLFEDESGENSHVYMMNTTLMDPYPEPLSAVEEINAHVDEDADDHLKHNVGVVRIRLPYDLPLKKYDFGVDQVWLADKYFPGMDDFGNTLER